MLVRRNVIVLYVVRVTIKTEINEVKLKAVIIINTKHVEYKDAQYDGCDCNNLVFKTGPH